MNPPVGVYKKLRIYTLNKMQPVDDGISYCGFNALTNSSKMSTDSKIKVLETCTLPFMTYGAQAWEITNVQLEISYGKELFGQDIKCRNKGGDKSPRT